LIARVRGHNGYRVLRAGAVAVATVIYRACTAMRAAGSRKSVQTGSDWFWSVSLTMEIFNLTNHSALNRFIITIYGNNFRKYDYKSPSLVASLH